jgi:hypothetical protein
MLEEQRYALEDACHKFPTTGYVISLLNNLEEDIKTVIDASVPNKAQNRAAQKMAADYFFRVRNDVIEQKVLDA